MNLFFDLDGTLIDSRVRVYSLFSDLSKVNIDFDTYWSYKKRKVSNENLLRLSYNFSEDSISEFLTKWKVEIESEKYLQVDRLFPFTSSVLEGFPSSSFSKYIVTNRQYYDLTKKQISELGILNNFDDLLVTRQNSSKFDLISLLENGYDKNDFIIGDTGEDIITGKELGIKTIAVLSGFRDETTLRTYDPDYIIEDIRELKKIIDESRKN